MYLKEVSNTFNYCICILHVQRSPLCLAVLLEHPLLDNPGICSAAEDPRGPGKPDLTAKHSSLGDFGLLRFTSTGQSPHSSQDDTITVWSILHRAEQCLANYMGMKRARRPPTRPRSLPKPFDPAILAWPSLPGTSSCWLEIPANVTSHPSVLRRHLHSMDHFSKQQRAPFPSFSSEPPFRISVGYSHLHGFVRFELCSDTIYDI
ncbi:hypothetical protein BX600DRAFT_436071 [Xylariales sp. PMI_506]|nr:hypothetical protein BX600DRAFT_436071 [Xylariales sp. PMI_506]